MNVNPDATPGISIGYSVGSLADWLRRITVRITGPRGSRGSGIMWRSGLVVTNAHVAASKMQFIESFDGSRTHATVVARDTAIDLAALALSLAGVPVAAVRSARGLRAGEMVIAVGNPLDGKGALSAGILHRAADQGPMILANIRLAPGNSGGPLADSKGNVIGVNTAIDRGLGCAITSDAVADFLEQSGIGR